jgi:hypothetical protein
MGRGSQKQPDRAEFAENEGFYGVVRSVVERPVQIYIKTVWGLSYPWHIPAILATEMEIASFLALYLEGFNIASF